MLLTNDYFNSINNLFNNNTFIIETLKTFEAGEELDEGISFDRNKLWKIEFQDSITSKK